MRRITHKILFTVIAAMLINCFGVFAEIQDIEYSTKVENPDIPMFFDENYIITNGSLMFEAEDMILDSDMIVSTSDAASGGKFIIGASGLSKGSNSGHKKPNYMKNVRVESAGLYTVWARLRITHNGADSITSAISTDHYTYMSLPIAPDWQWVKINSVGLPAGVVSIKFRYSEPAAQIDKILITADSEFTPVGMNDMPEPIILDSELYPEPEISPISGHPRLYLTKDYIPKLVENRNAPEHAKAWKTLDEWVELYIDTKLPENSAGNYSENLLMRIQARALKYVMDDSNKDLADETIRLAKDYLSTVTFSNGGDVTREKGATVTMGAIVYDWCYDRMTDADKEYFIKRFKELATSMEVGWPPSNLSSVTSHAGEAEITRDLLGAGVACYDEDPEIYNLAGGRFFSEMRESREIYYGAGAHPEGTSYGQYRFQWEAYAALIFDRMGIPNIYGENMPKVVYKWIYAKRPDGFNLKEGDDPTFSAAGYHYYMSMGGTGAMIAGSLYKDPYVRGAFLKPYALGGYASNPFWTVLIDDPSVGTKEPDDLPLTYFSSWPLTSMTARTSWQTGIESPAVLANITMKAINTGDHMHRDAGSFQIYYKGALAIDSGEYQGQNGGYGMPHDKNYNKRSIAHNVITVYDPEEVDTVVGGLNDGGQRFPKKGGGFMRTLDELMDPEAILTEELAHGSGPNEKTPEYSYLKGDLTKAYTDKITDYKRSFVFLNLDDEDYPAAVVVFDKVDSKNKDFKKSWLLHSIEEPAVEGDTTTIARTEYGFNGKLVNRTLLPEASNLVIEKIGGEGKEAWVDGQNLPNPASATGTEQGSWRIEASPKTAAESDLFLNAMYVTDNDAEAGLLNTEKIETEDYVGVTVKDRAVLFAKTAQPSDNDITISCDKETTFLITDVKEGVWSISGNGSTVYAESTKDENSLYFRVQPGEYVVSPANGESVEGTEYPEIETALNGDFNIYDSVKKMFLYAKYQNRLINGVPYMPAKHILEKYNASVVWDAEAGEVSITFSGKNMRIKSDSISAVFNGEEIQLTNAPVIIDGVTYIYPADFNAFMQLDFRYDETAKILFIETPKSGGTPVTGIDTEKIAKPVLIACSVDDGNVAENASDMNLSTRWSANGDGQWLLYDLGEITPISNVALAFYSGTQRQTSFDIQLSNDAKSFTTVYSGMGSGKTDNPELHPINFSARYVRFVGHGNNLNTWNSVSEMIVLK
ncbi:MAG: discoidin domain-containing protein [Clostridia bacterium]|nr:discoidin domain-containing protein [Clostridia bacterium]